MSTEVETNRRLVSDNCCHSHREAAITSQMLISTEEQNQKECCHNKYLECEKEEQQEKEQEEEEKYKYNVLQQERMQVHYDRLQMQLMAIHLQRMQSKTLPPMSFALAPITTLPLWQQIAASAAKRAREAHEEERKIMIRQAKVQEEINQYYANVKAREERIQRAQRQARAQYGSKIAQLCFKQWTRRGDVFEQLMKVEFDVVKQCADKRRQEDLLRETEELTKKLVESLLTARSKQVSSITSGITTTTTAAVAVTSTPVVNNSTEQTLEEEEEEQEEEREVFLCRTNQTIDCASLFDGKELDLSLSLLDTEKGARPLRDYQRTALHWMVQLYENKLNGILADEMGLGKTVQTIALLCYYAEYKNDWGPHLIVVPTTVVLNWRAEMQRWAPGLKILTYMGSAKERHRLRRGWTSEDAFHVCITSYNLIVQDRRVFRRRPWGFLILDEAHHVKNFMTKKWQSLFDLQAEYRLLLTGTPLQNSVMELWSLFHFLLPFASAFRSNEEFREWFSNPMDEMVSGQTSLNQEIVRRLQALIRPFMLRRLKKDVEAELPVKTEKVVLCRLSLRQRALYDDFMQLAETKRRLRFGGAGGVLSVLLSLRKVCNHPDLFEERPTTSPFILSYDSSIVINTPRVVLMSGNTYTYRFAHSWNDNSSHYVCEVNDVNYDYISDNNNDNTNNNYNQSIASKNSSNVLFDWLPCTWLQLHFVQDSYWPASESDSAKWCDRFAPHHLNNFINESTSLWKESKEKMLLNNSNYNNNNNNNNNHTYKKKENTENDSEARLSAAVSATITNALTSAVRNACLQSTERYKLTQHTQRQRYRQVSCATVNCYYPRQCTWALRCTQVCHKFPALCPTIAERVQCLESLIHRVVVYVPKAQPRFRPRLHWQLPIAHTSSFKCWGYEQAAALIGAITSIQRTHFVKGREYYSDCYDGSSFLQELWPLHVRRCFSFPDKRLLIHDCGKLQFLTRALKEMRSEGHRMLIFTQFVHMLDILEKFLALIGVAYLRLDGATRAELRQAYVDRFNEDVRITCMILSTRSGGIGLNLTGADTVIFYDSDWNPTMDLQAQDRCHRIGQTRPVTIYRLISEHTVEENILQKARERKKLNNVVIRGGQFHVIADVSEMYEDSSEAFVALSNPVNLRSFFHDLDEDAVLSTTSSNSVTQEKHHHNNNNNNKNNEINNNNSNNNNDENDGQYNTMNEADVLRAMLSVEDEEDRQAQQEVELELRERDAADQGTDEFAENNTSNRNNDANSSRNVFMEETVDKIRRVHEDKTLHYFDDNGECNSSTTSAISESAKIRRAICKRRREIIQRCKTPVDRFLTVHYAELNENDALERYQALVDAYASSMELNDKVDALPRFRLRLDK